MKEKWDDRYSRKEFAYGEKPNAYLREQLRSIPSGTILFPAEGEGRNAVYAATLGWTVFAFDLTIEGKKKALQLADKHQVEVKYDVGEFQSLSYKANQFDAIALIYAHFPASSKSSYHKILTTYLRPGGMLIFEAFSKKHMDYMRQDETMGGPKEIEMLFSLEEIASDFHNFDILELVEQEVELQEGLFHNGKGSVVRFVGRKR
ncbi:MAG: class I SAM-dependent methyltransferase [Candidatus Kapabacteria bacterium]|nr:class I SAM-dependent methyltransferase [Candidatus Kapabacteria bacterium]